MIMSLNISRDVVGREDDCRHLETHVREEDVGGVDFPCPWEDDVVIVTTGECP